MFKKGDIILVIAVLIAVVSGMIALRVISSSEGHRVAVIKQGDRIIRKIDLDSLAAPERIKLPGEYNEFVLVEKGRIRFQEADCPDKVCVDTGWLSEKGDTAVCLPNRAMLIIEGENKKLDGVAY